MHLLHFLWFDLILTDFTVFHRPLYMTKGGSGLSARAQTTLVRHLSIQPVPISINVCLVRLYVLNTALFYMRDKSPNH